MRSRPNAWVALVIAVLGCDPPPSAGELVVHEVAPALAPEDKPSEDKPPEDNPPEEAEETPGNAEPGEPYQLDFEATAEVPKCGTGAECRTKGLREWEKVGKVHPDTEYRQRAYMLFKVACESGDGWGCWEQATLQDSMFSVPPDQAQANDASALALFKQSCELGYGRGCYTFGMRHYKAGGRMEPDWDEARPWLEKSTALYTKACEGGEVQDCVLLAYNYNSGRGVERDPARAAKLYRRGCDELPKEGYSCDQLAMILAEDLDKPDVKGAHKAWAKGCARDPWHGCASLGKAFLDGDGVPQSDAKALSWLRRGCPKKGDTDGGACFLLKRMCDDGSKAACEAVPEGK